MKRIHQENLSNWTALKTYLVRASRILPVLVFTFSFVILLCPVLTHASQEQTPSWEIQVQGGLMAGFGDPVFEVNRAAFAALQINGLLVGGGVSDEFGLYECGYQAHAWRSTDICITVDGYSHFLLLGKHFAIWETVYLDLYGILGLHSASAKTEWESCSTWGACKQHTDRDEMKRLIFGGMLHLRLNSWAGVVFQQQILSAGRLEFARFEAWEFGNPSRIYIGVVAHL